VQDGTVGGFGRHKRMAEKMNVTIVFLFTAGVIVVVMAVVAMINRMLVSGRPGFIVMMVRN